MCLSTHTNLQDQDKGQQGTEATAETAKHAGSQFCVCVLYLSLCFLYRHVFYTCIQTMTVIKVIYSPKLATFFSRWHMRLIPFAEFERSGDGRVNNS